MSDKSQKKDKKEKSSLLFSMVKAPKTESFSKQTSKLGTKTRIPESLGLKTEGTKISSVTSARSFRFI